MGFFEDIGAAFGVGPGNKAQREAKRTQDQAKGVISEGGKTLGGIAGTSEAQSVANAAQAGSALGEQRGRSQAQEGTRSAMQAARTGGLNKGQAGILGSQQAGGLYAKGYETGQDKGIDAFGNATGQRIGAAQGQVGAGQAIGNVGQAQGQAGTAQAGALGGTIGGIAGGVGQALKPFDEGGIVEEPTAGIVGEAGPEAVIPLTDPARAAEVLKPIAPDHLDTVIALSRRIADLEAKLAEPKNA